MNPQDPLHAYAQKLIQATGATTDRAEILRKYRENAKQQVKNSYAVMIVVGTLFLVCGLTGTAYALGGYLELLEAPAKMLLGTLIASVSFVFAGALFLFLSRDFRVPWNIAQGGTLTRAVVISAESGTFVRAGKRGPITASLRTIRLAVQSPQGTPYETTTTTVDQVHGLLSAGEEVQVFVDPSNPKLVLVREPPIV